jgi:hypothetical protein
MKLGVYVSQHSSFGFLRRAARGNAMVANPTLAAEIRFRHRREMKRVACEKVGYGGTMIPLLNRKGA